MNDQNSFVGLIKVLWKWKAYIILACVLVGIISIIASLSLDNYYRASTIFYPASQENFKPEKVFGEGVEYFYGGREDLDRMLTIAQSSEVKDHLIDSLNLYEHYDIDPEGALAALKVRKKLASLMTVSKTKYGAVEIAVEDTDPKVASIMANSARIKTDQIVQRVFKTQLLNTMKTIQQDLATKEALVTGLEDSVQFLRTKYGIYDAAGQAEVLSTLVLEAKSKLARERARVDDLRKNSTLSRDTIRILQAGVRGLEKEIESLTSSDESTSFNLGSLNSGRERIGSISQRIGIESTQLSYQKLKLAQYQIFTDYDAKATFTVEEASVPYEKSRPRRSILVVGSVLAAFLFSIIAVLIIDRFRNINWESV